MGDGAVDCAEPLISEEEERADIFRNNPYLALNEATVTFTGRIFRDVDGSLHRSVNIQFPQNGKPAPLRVSPDDRLGWVYFIGPERGPIKIGFSVNPKARLNDIGLMSPVPLISHAVVAGKVSLERTYHSRFAAQRLHGEWFTLTPEIVAEIERLSSPSDGGAGL